MRQYTGFAVETFDYLVSLFNIPATFATINLVFIFLGIPILSYIALGLFVVGLGAFGVFAAINSFRGHRKIVQNKKEIDALQQTKLALLADCEENQKELKKLKACVSEAEYKKKLKQAKLKVKQQIIEQFRLEAEQQSNISLFKKVVKKMGDTYTRLVQVPYYRAKFKYPKLVSVGHIIFNLVLAFIATNGAILALVFYFGAPSMTLGFLAASISLPIFMTGPIGIAVGALIFIGVFAVLTSVYLLKRFLLDAPLSKKKQDIAEEKDELLSEISALTKKKDIQKALIGELGTADKLRTSGELSSLLGQCDSECSLLSLDDSDQDASSLCAECDSELSIDDFEQEFSSVCGECDSDHADFDDVLITNQKAQHNQDISFSNEQSSTQDSLRSSRLGSWLRQELS